MILRSPTENENASPTNESYGCHAEPFGKAQGKLREASNFSDEE